MNSITLRQAVRRILEEDEIRKALETKTMEDTIPQMQSDDYRDRFIAEYWQTKIRYEKLKAFNNRIEAAELTAFSACGADMPEHDCPSEMLRNQQRAMGEYLHILEIRAVIEHIDLGV